MISVARDDITMDAGSSRNPRRRTSAKIEELGGIEGGIDVRGSLLFTILVALSPLSLGALLVGCTSNRQVRTSYDASVDPAERKKLVVEQGEGFELGFVEFDDQGWFWDRRQLETVTGMIRKEAGLGGGDPRGLIVLSFVHGWKHDASFDDANVRILTQPVE